MNDRNSRAAGPHPKAGPAPQNAGEARASRLPEPEDFWLELGPPSAYYGTDAYDTARRGRGRIPRRKAPGLDRRRARPGRPGGMTRPPRKQFEKSA